MGQTQAPFISFAGTLYDPPYIVNGWDVPANTAYFLINFSTVGYINNTITYYLGAFQFGAKNFQPQFSVISPAGPWLDFGTAVTFPGAGGAVMFTNESLPALADNQPNVWVRMLSTSTPVGNGGDYIDEIEVLGTPLVPLSVNIADFTVKTNNSQNILNWGTASENNSRDFELQTGTDGATFSTIATIATKAINGNSNEKLNYSYVDADPAVGHNFYRLKMSDKDGQVIYSKVVDLLNTLTTEPVNIYPNPAKDVVNIDLFATYEYTATISLTDMLGKLVKKVNVQVVSGNNHIVTDMKGMVTGIYTLQISNENGVIHTQKLKGL